jgi:putative PIG3 family NAD(P)H quinone oxidoreductase
MSMRAIVITEPGGPEVLVLKDVETPSPSRGEVLVRVRATSVNRADLLQRMGLYPAPADAPKDIPGLELAGEVEQLGDGVTELAVGDRVLGVVSGGAYAEYVVAHARTLAKIPAGLSFTDAAALPEVLTTAYDAMVTQGGLACGGTVLVSAVGSGVGTAAVQIARAIGARSIGTARTADKIDRARALGMDDGFVLTSGLRTPEGKSLSDAVLERTAGRGVDVVLELAGGDYVAADLACTRVLGRIILVGMVAGSRADLDLGLLLRKRLTLRGTVLRARPLEEKILATRLLANNLLPLVASGAIRAVVDKVLPLANAAEAHAHMASNASFGKVVLEV